jgi:hypothetical protein
VRANANANANFTTILDHTKFGGGFHIPSLHFSIISSSKMQGERHVFSPKMPFLEKRLRPKPLFP